MSSPRHSIQPEPRQSISRSIGLAVILTLGINAVIPYIQHALHTVSLVEGMIPMGVLMPFLLLIFVINPILRLFSSSRCLRPHELIVIVSIIYACSHIDELLSRSLSMFSVLHYMATPENL